MFRIFVKGGAYATPEGVTIGMSEMDVRIRLGSPTHRFWDETYNYGWKLYYPGMLIIADESRGVRYIEICQPRRQRRARANQAFWCE